MNINFNMNGRNRKALAQAIAELTYSEMSYAGAPTFAYCIGDYTVDKNGAVYYPDTAAPEALALLIEKLKERGFALENTEDESPAEAPAETPDAAPESGVDAVADAEVEAPANGQESPDMGEAPVEEAISTEDVPEEVETDADTKDDAADRDAHLTISIPRNTLPDDALYRLKQIVANKETLLKRAVAADALPIEVTEEKISFPWFTLVGVDGEATAYAQFITALCRMAREQKRILDKPYDGDNDRFAMRIFMVRLGMKGAEYALARKLMMQRLFGNSGWRYGAPPKKRTEAAEVILPPTKEVLG